MRIGTIGYRTNTGLGYQVRDYVKHLGIEKVMVVDLSGHNGMPQNVWYPGAQTVKGYPRPHDILEFVKDLDVILLAETPLNYTLYDIAREKGVKTAVVPNWEFFDHKVHPEFSLPDLFIGPSVWHYDELKEFADLHGVKCIQLHHPVDMDVFKPRVRTTKKFIHIAGRPATQDRNGTWDFMQAVPNGVVVCQNKDMAHQIRSRYRHCNVFTDVEDAAFMYQLGDIMVLPRKYGGNCLPLNEALASGMPVIMTNVSPNNHLLPQEWLVGAKNDGFFTPRERVDLWQADPQELAAKVEWFRNCDIEAESKRAIEIAKTISWDALKPKYLEALESL